LLVGVSANGTLRGFVEVLETRMKDGCVTSRGTWSQNGFRRKIFVEVCK